MVSLPKPYIASSTNNLHPHTPSQIQMQALKNPPNPPPPSLPHFTPPPEDCSKPYRPNLTSPPSTQKLQLLATSSLKDAQSALSTHQALSMPFLVNVRSFTLVKQNAQQPSELLKRQLPVLKLTKPINSQPTKMLTSASQPITNKLAIPSNSTQPKSSPLKLTGIRGNSLKGCTSRPTRSILST